MRRNARTIAPMLLVLAVLGVVLWVNAGDLTPPPGPVGPTMHTLDEIYNLVANPSGGESRIAVNAENTPGDPTATFKITQPGSYYLTGNITGESGKSGMEVAASDVTLDLNGFALAGVSGSANGITVGGSRLNIFNGTIRNWDGSGVSGSSSHSLFSRLRLSDNNGDGLFAGEHCIIVDCTADWNDGYGFRTSDYTAVERCTAGANGNDGFRGSAFCVFKKCIAATNNGDGFRLVYSVATECTSSSNDGDGMQVYGSSLVLNNICSDHSSGAGIRVIGDMSRIEANHVAENQTGIEAAMVSDGNFIIRNTAVGNTTNYNIHSSNKYGQIVTPSAGFSNSNPWANFSWGEG